MWSQEDTDAIITSSNFPNFDCIPSGNMAEELPRQTFLNPVIAPPWMVSSSGFNMNYSVPTPPEVPEPEIPPKKISPKTLLRNQNIAMLMATFPGLKKYEARAALTLGRNQMESARRLVLMAKSYHITPESAREDSQALHKFGEHYCPYNHYRVFGINELRNVMEEFGHKSGDDEGSRDSGRTGVVLVKTSNGYRASPL